MKTNIASAKSTRRDLIKQSAASAFAGSLAFPSILSAAPNTQTLRIGLIGCGGRGTAAAMEALNADANTVVVALGDVFEDRLSLSLERLRQHAGDRVKVDKSRCFLGFDAYEKVIASDVDVVLLASPPAFRPQHLKAAIDAGTHVFAECIAAVDAPGIRSFLDSAARAEERGLGILSGFCWRYDNTARAAREQIRAGAIGQVRTVYATYYRQSFNKYYGKERRPEWSDLEWQIRDWSDFLWLGGDMCIGLSGGHSADKMAWVSADGNSTVRAIPSTIARSSMNTPAECAASSGCVAKMAATMKTPTISSAPTASARSEKDRHPLSPERIHGPSAENASACTRRSMTSSLPPFAPASQSTTAAAWLTPASWH
jgi:myo-inositol 2-dehydrogenase / D-chiro-inositol 1-dehydrogenase